MVHAVEKRHGIGCNAISGNMKSANNEAAKEYPLKLHEILDKSGYREECVYICDETGLMLKMLPRKTSSLKSDRQSAQASRKLKNVILLLTANKTGKHKLKPLCIEKYRNPRAFHHINRKILSCMYDHSKNACMASVVFENWFHSECVPSAQRYLVEKDIEPKAFCI